MQRMHEYRRHWMSCMLARDNRMVDTQIIANLMRSASFFASPTGPRTLFRGASMA